MGDPTRFEELFLPHLDAADNLARWLGSGEQDAEDIVQEAYARAFKGFAGFRGDNPRAWLLTIVRNTAYTWLKKHANDDKLIPFDEQAHAVPVEPGRFHWSRVPVWLQWIGGAAVPLAFWIFDRTFKENTFATPVVRIQKERGHKVISTGPYSIVRHPLYSGAMLLMPSMALLLGSFYGLLGSLILYTVLVFRTIMEDQTLMRELNGYPEYARHVRYRLIPFVW
jgi:RNA polymerase sigma factor (sigma-70 family)